MTVVNYAKLNLENKKAVIYAAVLFSKLTIIF